jgi:hypothetical protein
MKSAIVSKDTEKLFSPVFRTMLGGKQVSVSLKDFKENWSKYVNSDIGYLYSNRETLIESLSSVSSKKEAVVVNMDKGTRGSTFNKDQSEKEISSEVSKMLSEQLERRSRLKKRFEKNKLKTKKQAEAEGKKQAEAEKAEAKKQKEDSDKIEAAKAAAKKK